MAFAQSFNGQQVSVGSLKFKVTKAFISKATGLPMVGERWYKKKTVRIGDFTTFLKPPVHYGGLEVWYSSLLVERRLAVGS